jgi:hypothetical protein
MAYFLFIDESGQDHHDSPYEVLAGVSIKDEDLWNLIKSIHDLEISCFGKKYRDDKNEIKARKFLKKKTFRLASQLPPIPVIDRTENARKALDPSLPVTKLGLTALAQAKLDYAKQIFELCIRFRCKIFASIIADPGTIPDDNNMLRKDYVYLFERFYYFLEDKKDQMQGIVVFDELDKSASHLVLSQMDRYFKSTLKGRTRSALIIPEPFFVHSDLTTGIQIVDFIAYILSWNFRAGKLDKVCREELNAYLELLKPMRYITSREIGDVQNHTIWSVVIV